ncbi:hypothetical protein CTI12_AA086920 [Artemisia annua]|uniref:Uncharacterized protein n=1 Tax=Artemisia annua TaxID=35608 RepID=A0A2U1Q1A0_ARTAN|nr:hypothetical protein CTI12_AA086920 [Artemisia annua]
MCVFLRELLRLFFLMTIADFSYQLFGFQDVLFENTNGMLRFEEKRGLYGCEEVLRKSVEKNPFAGEQHVVLGQIYLGQGRFEEAEKESEERLRLILEWGSPWIRECCGKVGMLVAEFWL